MADELEADDDCEPRPDADTIDPLMELRHAESALRHLDAVIPAVLRMVERVRAQLERVEDAA